MSEWLPIESAPRDGTPILGHCKGRIEIYRWDDQRYKATPQPFWVVTGCHSVTLDRSRQPTDWMPLPAPPH